MTWPSFSLLYAIVALAGLLLCRSRLRDGWRPIARSLAGATLMLCIFDGVAESRLLWQFPVTLGIYILNVPIENILIVIASATNSLLLFVLFDERPLS